MGRKPLEGSLRLGAQLRPEVQGGPSLCGRGRGRSNAQCLSSQGDLVCVPAAGRKLAQMIAVQMPDNRAMKN